MVEIIPPKGVTPREEAGTPLRGATAILVVTETQPTIFKDEVEKIKPWQDPSTFRIFAVRTDNQKGPMNGHLGAVGKIETVEATGHGRPLRKNPLQQENPRGWR